MTMTKKLYKSNDRIIGGVFGGIAEYFGWDKTVVRLIGTLIILFVGQLFLGVLAYFIAMEIMPNRPDYQKGGNHRSDAPIEGEFEEK
ncbi:hypothetical protein FC60_GL001433 [Limosilactobacillus gastricus DSM 16045]|uniref:Phage shock protein PspC N-terminal domain-containing protein n=2 Tax=Limosilactobacillus gastricus TaxID=227942 RepID=A0A0R1VC55_9LACO|nr:PspC domain-containing protein [Limosilactobacillus gastricus]KRM03137.1 hypothetical protein FC60_GL001433 [Limosilactobacillus gastricus DSM 16045]